VQTHQTEVPNDFRAQDSMSLKEKKRISCQFQIQMGRWIQSVRMTFEPEYRQIKVEPLREFVFVTGHHQVMTCRYSTGSASARRGYDEEEREKKKTLAESRKRNTLKS
jgi:hypothetical protein